MHGLPYLPVGTLADDSAKFIDFVDILDPSELTELIIIEELF